MSTESRSPSVRLDPVWVGRAALLFVLLALAGLVAVPALLQSRQDPLRRAAEAADAARTLVSGVQFALARQMSALRGAVVAPDGDHPAAYADARAMETEAYRALDSLGGALSPHERAALARLTELSRVWHERLDAEAVLARGAQARGELLGPDLQAYERTLVAARALDEALAAGADDRRRRIRAAERDEDRIAAGMAAAALAAAATVGWFGHRMRGLAAAAAAGRRQAEEALGEMQRLAVSRERLVRGITHDLKNPLGAADGYAQLLRDGVEGPLPEAQARMVDSIIRCHATALALIDDLLDFSRAESGEVVLAVGPTDCAAIVDEAVDAYAGAARAAGHDIRLHPPGEPLPCVTDHERVVHIVGNLLSNAIKYTPAPGVVTVAARAVPRGPGPGHGPGVEVEVSDTGPGIPPAERTRIFEEFVRLDTTGRGGHGLGLATSLRIARRLGGEITVADAPAGGAAFRLWLPHAPAAATHLPGG